jgi:hypothetical protein
MKWSAETLVGSPSELLHLRSYGLRFVFLLIFMTQLLLALATVGGVDRAWPVLVALLVFGASLAIVAIPHSEPLPGSWVLVVIAGIVLTNMLVLWNLPISGAPGYADWSFGAGAWLSFFLALRGRVGAAWLGWVLMATVTQIWSLSINETPLQSLGHVIRHAGTILIASLFRILLVRANRVIANIQAERLIQVAAEAESLAEIRERTLQAMQLNQEARPALLQIADGNYLTGRAKQRYRLLEANLRDGLRGGGIMSQDVREAVERARKRGGQVVLLDDRNAPLVEADSIRLRATVVGELSQLTDGRLTARLLPEGRATIASVVSTSGDTRHRVDLVDERHVAVPEDIAEDVPPI